MPDEPGKKKTLQGEVKSFMCGESPSPCVVEFVDGATVIHAKVNDRRMLTILGVAVGTAKRVLIEYIEARPAAPTKRRIDLLVGVTLSV